MSQNITSRVKSGNHLIDWLETQLWFEYNGATVIKHRPTESQQTLHLQFTDSVNLMVCRRYESNDLQSPVFERTEVERTMWSNRTISFANGSAQGAPIEDYVSYA
jgi:hypothetical protein